MSGPVSDVWAAIADLDAAAQERLAGVLETRGADPRQQAMRRAFLADVAFPADARVLEVGCGSGVLTHMLARWPNVDAVVGVDPTPFLLARARDLAADVSNVTFEEADGRALPFANEGFDVVIFDSTLSHMSGPERAVAEVFRALRPGGVLALFDGDHATTTVALGDHDPLQTCVDSMTANSVTDRWVVCRRPALARGGGFTVADCHSHGSGESGEGGSILTIVDRGADLLRGFGQIAQGAAAALKSKARRRVAAGVFFGHIASGSLVAH